MFFINMRWNQILFLVAVTLLLILLHLNSDIQEYFKEPG